jgi:hypothetical protein
MVRSIVRHNVDDYGAWRRVYDEFQGSGVPAERGVRDHAVYQAVDNPNDVTVTHDFDDAGTAQAFFASEDLKGALGAAGVQLDSMALWFVNA